jgi:predicted nucleotidyltransferase
MAPARIEVPTEEVAEFCRRNRIRRLALFGSVIRDDFRPDSDIDVLVEFQPDARVGFELFRMEEELSELLGGREVEINTPRSLSKYFRNEVLREAEIQYDSP